MKEALIQTSGERVTQMHFKTHYLASSWKLQKGQQELLINVFGGLLPVTYKYCALVYWDHLPDGVSSCY